MDMPLHKGRVRGGTSKKVTGTPQSRAEKTEETCTQEVRSKFNGHPFSKDNVKKL